ncbi:MAG TPA: crotonase/enoyl-CoA hydratase family protein, partial [Alphaproteobacteria bacterium]|nr:crotonase/enoyl-CoA hydratase family protein [Alphaproteobacteria bacterium]
MAYSTLTLEMQDHVARVTLNRPARLNTMNRAFWREIREAFAEIEAEASVRAVLLASTGRHFTAGLDLKEFGGNLVGEMQEPARRAGQLRRMIREMQESFSVIDRCRAPVIAAIQGGCIGGGIDMVSACDIRLCTEDAFFTVQEINIAITADVGTLQRLPHLLPQGVVRELAYTGRNMAAEEARQWGFVNRVYTDHAALLDGAGALAAEIAGKAPLAMAGTKEMLNYARDHSIADGLNYVATWNAAMLSAADLGEAVTARQQKRAADYADLPPARQL